MTRTAQRLATTGLFNIGALAALNVQTLIIDKDGLPRIPNFVEFDQCGLEVIAKNADGSFDVFNPDPVDKTNVRFRAHHLHSEEQEPIYPVTPTTQASTVPLPDCILFGGWPYAVAHNRFDVRQGVEIPPGPSFLVPQFDQVLCNQDHPSSPYVTISGGRVIINRSGVYRIKTSLPHTSIGEVPVRVELGIYMDPAGSPALLPPSSSSETLSGGEFNTSESSSIIAVDGSWPVGQRTFEVRASGNIPGALAGNGVIVGEVEVYRLGEKRPVVS